jgi:xanthine dehydrogenase molybdopterin-binding subunit B
MKYYLLTFIALSFIGCAKPVGEKISKIPEASGISYCNSSDTLIVANDEGTYYEINRKGKILQKKKLGKYDLEGVVCEDEKIYIKHAPHNFLTYKQLVLGYVYPNGNSIGGPVIGRGRYIAQGLTNLDLETGQGLPALDWTYGAHGVEIEVDVETGDIEIIKIATSLDAGKVLNEQQCYTQVIGGVVQGIGSALLEEFKFDKNGRFLNAGFVDYKIPTAKDLPKKFAVHFVETPLPDGPYGARGIAEHPMISVPGAIGNALYYATGVHTFDLPLSRERVCLALRKK